MEVTITVRSTAVGQTAVAPKTTVAAVFWEASASASAATIFAFRKSVFCEASAASGSAATTVAVAICRLQAGRPHLLLQQEGSWVSFTSERSSVMYLSNVKCICATMWVFTKPTFHTMDSAIL